MSDMPSKDEQLATRFASAFTVKKPDEAQPATNGQLGQRAGRTGDTASFRLTLDRLRPDDDQVRCENKGPDDPDTIDLAASIKAIGLKTPIQVRWIQEDDIYEIIAGERRYQAAKLAGLPDVPVRLENVDEKQARLIQLHENIHRADLTAIELATALSALKADGMTNEQIAQTIKKSEAYVSIALTVAKGLTPEAKAVLNEPGAAPVGMDVLHTVARQPAADQAALAGRIKAEKKTRKQLREEMAETQPAKGATQPKPGRPSQSKPYSKSFKANGGSVTVQFKRAKVTTDEVIETLEQVLASLKAE